MEKVNDSVDVFSYQDFRSYLKDFYRERRQKDRKFSIRFFARRAGLRSQNYLKVVMDGRRSLTPRNVPKFIKGLGLDSTQALYFEALVNLNQARDGVERRQYLDRLSHLQKKKAQLTLKGKQLEFFNNWYHIVIFEMSCQDHFDPKPQAISERLQKKITAAEAEESLALMLELGILIKDDEGNLIPIAKQVAFSKEAPPANLKRLQVDFAKLALEAIQKPGAESSDMKCLTIGLTSEQVPVFHEKIREFQQELNTLFSTGQGSDIYQFNVQFFKLTKSRGER